MSWRNVQKKINEWIDYQENFTVYIDTQLWLEKSKKLAAQSPKYNNKAYIVVDNSSDATHWMATEDERWKYDSEIGITPNKMYRLFYDQYDDEITILDDNGNLSMEYMAHHGEWVVMEGSDRWMDYVKKKCVEEERPSVKERLEQSLIEMQQIRNGEKPKKTWAEIRQELKNEFNT